jgi:hypothetical protein
MKVKEVLKLLEENGWYLARTKAAIDSSSIPTSRARSPLRGNQVLIYLKAR